MSARKDHVSIHVLIIAFLKSFCVLLIVVKLDYYLHRLRVLRVLVLLVVQGQHQSSLVDDKNSLLSINRSLATTGHVWTGAMAPGSTANVFYFTHLLREHCKRDIQTFTWMKVVHM